VFKPLKKQRQIMTFEMLEFKRQRCNNQTVAPRHSQTGGNKMTQGITAAEVAKPKQTTRLRKVFCEIDGYIARISRSTLITYGSPICPACNQAMKEVK